MRPATESADAGVSARAASWAVTGTARERELGLALALAPELELELDLESAFEIKRAEEAAALPDATAAAARGAADAILGMSALSGGMIVKSAVTGAPFCSKVAWYVSSGIVMSSEWVSDVNTVAVG